MDIAMLDAMLFQSNGLPTLGALGIEPTRMGNEFRLAVPANVYQYTDGPLYVGILLDSHWRLLPPVLGQRDLADHESFATRDARAENRDACNMLLGGWLAGLTRAEALAQLRAFAGAGTRPAQRRDPGGTGAG